MINSYCRICGLYITVPDDFAGGLGSCPRCQTRLRIPRKPPEDTPGFKKGMRLIAEPTQACRVTLPAIVTPGLGPSKRYTCTKCGEQFESLQGSACPAGQCPNCKHVNEPVVNGVSFPRPPNESASRNPTQTPSEGELAAASAAVRAEPAEQEPPTPPIPAEPTPPEPSGQPAPAEACEPDDEWTSEEGYLLAKPARNQVPDETVLQGMAIDGEMTVEEHLDARSELLGAEQDTPETLEAGDSAGGKQWHYLQKDEQCGPVSAGQIGRLLSAGKINLSTLVWSEGMDGWVPLETVEELTAQPKDAADWAEQAPPEQPPRRKSRRARRTMAALAQSLLWMGIASACVLLMVYLLRDNILLLGGGAYAMTSAGLAAAVLAAIAYGLAGILPKREQFRAAPGGVRSQAMLGMGVLAAVFIVAVTLACVVRPRAQEFPTERYLADARRAYQVILAGQSDQMYRVIDWHHVKLNGQDLGSAYTKAKSVEEKDEIAEAFLSSVRPVLQEMSPRATTGPADAPLQWRVAKHKLSMTTVELLNPATGRAVAFEMQAGMVVGVRYAVEESAPTTGPAED
jgi:hypothetical protein